MLSNRGTCVVRLERGGVLAAEAWVRVRCCFESSASSVVGEASCGRGGTVLPVQQLGRQHFSAHLLQECKVGHVSFYGR